MSMISLKEHQEEVDRQIKAAIGNLREENFTTSSAGSKMYAISLQAPTGAGKTINIGSILSSITNGYFKLLKNSPILYVSASPDLNIQTMKKLEKNYPLLKGKMNVIDNSFNQGQLPGGEIFFINTQKLGKNKNLTKGDIEESTEYNFWKVWEEACLNSSTPAILIIDESHQGMNKTSVSIAQRLIQGKDKKTPVPLVIGMSATPTKFRDIVSKTHTVNCVDVELKDVKKSGLIKDSINIFYSGEEKGAFEDILLSVTAKEYIKYSQHWDKWCKDNNHDTVVPLLVCQVEDKVSGDRIVQLCHKLIDNIPDLNGKVSFAHNISSFPGTVESHNVIVHKVDPSDVQDDTRVKVFFIKESATAGWDCPRAEVLFSLRPHSDSDYIIQMIGRVLRTPMAHRIEGMDVLNSVSVILPRYDIKKVEDINYRLQHGGIDGNYDGDDNFLDTTLNPVTVSCHNDEAVEKLKSLVSFTSPHNNNDTPLKTMRKIALELSRDGISVGGKNNNEIIDYEDLVGKFATKLLSECSVYKEQIDSIIEDLENIQVGYTTVDNMTGETINKKIDAQADSPSIESYISDASQAFAPDIVQQAVKKHMAESTSRKSRRDKRKSLLLVAAASQCTGVKESLNDFANKFIDMWLNGDDFNREILRLGSEKSAKYRKFKEQSTTPREISVILEDSKEVEKSTIIDGEVVDYPVFKDFTHIYSTDNGDFPCNLNRIERLIIDNELENGNAELFYRNPTSGKSSFKVPYIKDGEEKVFSPDFITFSYVGDELKASIVDPHGIFLEDSLDKLQGMAHYAQKYGKDFLEIRCFDGVENNGKILVIDLNDKDTQDHVLSCTTISEVYDTSKKGIVREVDISTPPQ